MAASPGKSRNSKVDKGKFSGYDHRARASGTDPLLRNAPSLGDRRRHDAAVAVAKVGEAMLGNFTAMFLHQGYGSFDPVFLVRGSPYYDGMWFYALSLALVGLGVVCWGAFRRPREHVDWWLIIVLLASRTGVHLVLASAYRYRAPLEPYLIMLAAVGVTQLVHSLDANWAGGRRLRHATRPA